MKFPTLDRLISRSLLVLLVTMAGVAAWSFRPVARELEPYGVGRRALVVVSGQHEQIPTADYLTSPGGVSVNGTAASAGDLEATTLTVSNGANMGSATVTGNLIAGTETLNGAMDMTSHQIHNLADPTSNQDAATQAYVLLHGGGGGSGVSSLACGTGIVCTPSSPLIAPGTVSYDPSLIPTYTGASAANQVPKYNGTTHVFTPSSILDTGTLVSTPASGSFKGQQFVIGAATGANLTLDDTTNGFSTGSINFTGYNGGTTQFREFQIYDGKQHLTADFNGGAANNQIIFGPGTDTSGTTGTEVIVTRAGQTNLAIRDSTNDVEIENVVNASGGFVGTLTNSVFHIQTNSTNALQIDTSQNSTFFGAVVVDGNWTVAGGTARNQIAAAQTAAPTVNNGSLSADASNFEGRVSGVGPNTSVTLTFGGGGYANIAHCSTQIIATVAINVGYIINVTTASKTAPVFGCHFANGQTLSAANCPDFEYTCWGN